LVRIPRLLRSRRALTLRSDGRRRRLSRPAQRRLWAAAGIVLIVLLSLLVLRQLMVPRAPPPDSGIPSAPAVGQLVEPVPAVALARSADPALPAPEPPPAVAMAELALPRQPVAAEPTLIEPDRHVRDVGELASLVPFGAVAQRGEAAALEVSRPPLRPPAPPIVRPELALAVAPVLRPPLAPAPRRSAPRPPDPSGQPLITVIIDDIGPAHALSARAVRLPGRLTMSFLPYADDLPELIRAARAAGHEIFLHMPMQPLGDADPGPHALIATMSADQLRTALDWGISRVEGAVGVNNHMGSRMTRDPAVMRVVIADIGRHDLAFVDSRTIGNSVAAGVAAEQGVPHTSRDIFIDHKPGRHFAEQQLAALEALARRTGTAVAIGHPYETTLGVLARWIPEVQARGFRLVTATQMIAARGCGGPRPAGHGCGLLREASPDPESESCGGEEPCRTRDVAMRPSVSPEGGKSSE
jgi:polysaccharide deacetylase 2 family uncharacterized protein YibQ